MAAKQLLLHNTSSALLQSCLVISGKLSSTFLETGLLGDTSMAHSALTHPVANHPKTDS